MATTLNSTGGKAVLTLAHVVGMIDMVALPLWTWLFTVCVLLLGGPGGDIVFAGVGWRAVGPVLVLVLGAGPATWYLTRRRAAPS